MSAGLSAGAIIGIAGAAASVGSSLISSNAATSAANTQAGAQEEAAQIQQNEFNTITQQEQPFMTAGVNATGALSDLLGLTPGPGVNGLPSGYLNQTLGPFSFNPSSITSSPGYQFSQSQGLQQTQNAIAPNVGALSGPALQALTNYATGNAEQYYNNYFNQAQSQYSTNLNSLESQQQGIFGRLSAIAGLGQNAASNTGSAGATLGTGTAQAIAGAGASQAAGTIGSANALSGGISGVGNSIALSSILNANSASSGLASGSEFNGTAPGTNGLLAAGS
jgi:hypothetical protein